MYQISASFKSICKVEGDVFANHTLKYDGSGWEKKKNRGKMALSHYTYNCLCRITAPNLRLHQLDVW